MKTDHSPYEALPPLQVVLDEEDPFFRIPGLPQSSYLIVPEQPSSLPLIAENPLNSSRGQILEGLELSSRH
ncbi:hypothetical protein D3C86_1758750 [compost metagenome]